MKQSMKRNREEGKNFSANPQLNIMEQIARKAMTPFRKAFNDIEHKLVTKEGASDFAEEMDEKLLTYFKKELAFKTPETPVVAYSESGKIPTSGNAWLVHSCGSFVNLCHGQDNVAMYMAYMVDGKIQSALIYNPLANLIYAIEKGKGAFSMQGRLRVSGKDMVENSMLSIFSPVSQTKDEDSYLNILKMMRSHKCHIRISGSSMHDALQLSAGKLDAVIALNLNPADVLLADFIIKESGGYSCETNGTSIEVGSTSLVAANSKLHGKLLKIMAGK